MRLDRKDISAGALALLGAVVFVIAAAGWGVPLIGDSHRWATVLILIVGIAAGELSAPGKDAPTGLIATLVIAGFLCAVIALATAALVPVALLAADVVLLVAVGTFHHIRSGRERPASSAPLSPGSRP